MKVRGPHETHALVALHVRSHELGRSRRPLLLRYRKEGRLVEEQVLAHSQELRHAQLQVEVVRDLNRFNALAPEWDRLLERSGVNRVFLSHTWFRTWWEAFGAGNELHVVTVRSRGELLAAAPMMRTNAGVYGI